ncbi:MAG: DNA-3-methyladenine glycosylase I [Planctomycetes bacterium]|nr:DNA-3-methyladenine glycosylase I [Planctomycetota bacterium]
MSIQVIHDDDGLARCSWCGQDPEYRAYHDREWGFPVTDDRRLYEKICLEGFQSGLSWLTILRKRLNFRRAFADFDFERVATFGASEVKELLADAGIVRHRGKIEATIGNARAACRMVEAEGSLSRFFWSFEPPRLSGGGPAQTEASKAMAKELKRRGWRFVGPTTAYAFMQSVGIVNDHLPGCHARDPAEVARAGLRKDLNRGRR